MSEMYPIRSDFADEFITQNVKSKTYEHVEKQNDFVKSNFIKVLEEENELGKEVGDYVSIECKNINDHDARAHMIEAICESLTHMCDDMKLKHIEKVLVVGLGNRFITSDALGPGVADEILVTSHLYELEDQAMLTGTRNVAVLQPGVMGQTGLESGMIIESVAGEYKPDLIIAIDALATRNIARINRVVQINNTGIQPGSGVGNHRRPLNEETMHAPLIAIGVATVTSIGAILKEALDDTDIDGEIVLQHLSQAKRLDLVVTPKSMDDELKHLIYIVSESLNNFLHPDYENL